MARRRRARRSRKQGQGRKWLYEALFFGLWLVPAAIAYYLKDFNGVRLGLGGSYLWVMAFFFGFSFYLLYLLQFVLPISWYLSMKEGLMMIIDPTFPYASKVVRMLLGRPIGRAASESLLRELPPSFESFRAGILPSHLALALTKGPKYERAAGPGYVRLERGETVLQVVDLREQTRTVPVKAMTRDGIPIETSVNVTFQVQMRESPFGPVMPYPYDAEAIFGVNYLSNYRTENGVLPWGDRIANTAASILIAELAQYALDELYQPEQPSFSPRKRIANRTMQKLDAQFKPAGITILHAGPGRFEVPDEVVVQLISNWQTEWQQRIDEVEAATAAAAMQRLKLAQARAELEIIVALTESIRAMQSSSDEELTEIVTIRMLEAMREAAEDEQVRAIVPSQALDSMQQLQDWLRS